MDTGSRIGIAAVVGLGVLWMVKPKMMQQMMRSVGCSDSADAMQDTLHDVAGTVRGAMRENGDQAAHAWRDVQHMVQKGWGDLSHDEMVAAGNKLSDLADMVQAQYGDTKTQVKETLQHLH